jgi:predicted protein tyrosine phosphatase
MNIIGAFDKGRIETFVPRPDSILISITSQQGEFPHLNSKWKDVLYLKFDDDEKDMIEEDAKKILDFVIKNIGCDVFVNCEAGLSRSPAVVVALEQIFNARDLTDFYKHHNKFVKNKIKDVWFRNIWKN